MSRRRRTRFAAPLVIIAACSHDAGRGGPRPMRAWDVEQIGERCRAMVELSCPEGASCNPPAPMEYPCPGFPAAHARVVSDDGTICRVDGSRAVVVCPSYAPPITIDAAPPIDAAAAVALLRSWSVFNDGKRCQAIEDVRCPRGPNGELPPCNPPPPSPVPCDAFGKGPGKIQEVSPGACQVYGEVADCPPNAKCNPPPPVDIACPKW